MKTEMHYVPRMTIEEFADKHNLVMEVHERSPQAIKACSWIRHPFFAEFKHTAIKNESILSYVHGNGQTPEEAIQDYARQISEQLLVIDNNFRRRITIQAPILILSEKEEI